MEVGVGVMGLGVCLGLDGDMQLGRDGMGLDWHVFGSLCCKTS